MSTRSRCEQVTTSHGSLWWLDETTWLSVDDPGDAGPAPTTDHPAVQDLLVRRRLLVEAPTTHAWQRLHLAVVGTGAMARQVCKELLRSGLGRLDCLDASPPGRDGAALARALRSRHRARITCVDEVAALPGRGVDLVLVACSTVEPDRLLLADLVRHDLPHLVLGAHGDVGRIGPLVRPGRGPCQSCADLARGRLEPAWPQVLATLGTRPARPHPTMTSLVAARAALAVGWLARGLDDGSGLEGCVEVVDLWDPQPRTARFGVHPDCGCRWQPI